MATQGQNIPATGEVAEFSADPKSQEEKRKLYAYISIHKEGLNKKLGPDQVEKLLENIKNSGEEIINILNIPESLETRYETKIELKINETIYRVIKNFEWTDRYSKTMAEIATKYENENIIDSKAETAEEIELEKTVKYIIDEINSGLFFSERKHGGLSMINKKERDQHNLITPEILDEILKNFDKENNLVCYEKSFFIAKVLNSPDKEIEEIQNQFKDKENGKDFNEKFKEYIEYSPRLKKFIELENFSKEDRLFLMIQDWIKEKKENNSLKEDERSIFENLDHSLESANDLNENEFDLVIDGSYIKEFIKKRTEEEEEEEEEEIREAKKKMLISVIKDTYAYKHEYKENLAKYKEIEEIDDHELSEEQRNRRKNWKKEKLIWDFLQYKEIHRDQETNKYRSFLKRVKETQLENENEKKELEGLKKDLEIKEILKQEILTKEKERVKKLEQTLREKERRKEENTTPSLYENYKQSTLNLIDKQKKTEEVIQGFLGLGFKLTDKGRKVIEHAHLSKEGIFLDLESKEAQKIIAHFNTRYYSTEVRTHETASPSPVGKEIAIVLRAYGII